tara:strand:- start:170 stop:466 length:297 start_codon:yes stop_codon:yes gene_type:complete
MKNIDPKSLIIGVLLSSIIILGVAATGKTDKWDDQQEWQVSVIGWDRSAKKWWRNTTPDSFSQGSVYHSDRWPRGWEPIGQALPNSKPAGWLARKRIK